MKEEKQLDSVQSPNLIGENPMSESKPVTLLVIDDDPTMVRMLTKMIERSFGDQIRIKSLTDPAEARVQIEGGSVDILLTELDMPCIDGLELLRAAKRRNAFTQVLFLTGHSSLDALLDHAGLKTAFASVTVGLGALLEDHQQQIRC